MPKTKHPERVIRANDLVKIVDPRVVLRVGYPKCVEDFLPEVAERHCKAVGLLYKEVTGYLPNENSSRTVEKILRELAHAKLAAERYGGRERSLHFSQPFEELRGKVFAVMSVRSVVTGIYCPGRAGYGYTMNGFDEGDAPCLDDAKTHRLATLGCDVELDPDKPYVHTFGVEFPVAALRKMASCKACDEKKPGGAPHTDIHFTTTDWDENHSGYCARCYYCGTPFEEMPVG